MSAQSQIGSGGLATLQGKRQAFSNSLPIFAAHNYAQGEAVLEAANLQSAGTPEWQVESGFELQQAAFAFKGQGDAATSAAVAQLALGHLNQADQALGSSANPAEVADERELTGYIEMYLLGDEAAALPYFEAAVALSPNTGRAAIYLTLIRKHQAALARKLAAKSG